MTERHETDEPKDGERDDETVRNLLKRALATDVVAKDTPDLLRGVQRRIRRRSRGKFFADGWSTSDARVSHALIAAAMLLIVLVAYFALGPTGVQ